MSILEVVLLALALSADAFSVAAVVGCKACAPRQRFRLSFHFGIFQTLMPVLGALLGHFVQVYVQAYDHWIASGLLFIIGAKMCYEALEKKSEDEEAECRDRDPTRGWSLVGLSIATSIDAFGAGVSMAMVLNLGALLLAAAWIGITCGAITYLGMRVGGLIQRVIGKKVELIGGLTLIGLGVKMLWI
jgi:manganese efflux pump family protein